jgi:hypothetical protein
LLWRSKEIPSKVITAHPPTQRTEMPPRRSISVRCLCHLSAAVAPVAMSPPRAPAGAPAAGPSRASPARITRCHRCWMLTVTAGCCGTSPHLAGVALHGSTWGVSWPSRPPRARRCPGRIALLEADIARRPLVPHGYFRLVIAAPERDGIARRDKCEGRDENRGDGRAPLPRRHQGPIPYICAAHAGLPHPSAERAGYHRIDSPQVHVTATL